MSIKSVFLRVQGVAGNPFVTQEFIEGLEAIASRLETRPEHILASMSFETGGTFNPGIQNHIGATGLIQFLRGTAIGLGTTTDELKRMSSVEQLRFVERYFAPFKGRLDTLEAVYTAILSGSPKKPNEVLFRDGTAAYRQNPLDWNLDGEITAREATTPVAARLFGGITVIQERLLELNIVPQDLLPGFVDGRWGKNTSTMVAEFQRKQGLPDTGLIDEATGAALVTDRAGHEEIILRKGDKGPEVSRLQETLINLGYLRRELVGSGAGNFGPLTEAALKAFQDDVGIEAAGAFGLVETNLTNAIRMGIGKGSSLTQLVRAIQKRLVIKRLLTQAQVDTGFGTFGPQTDAAVKRFQSQSVLPASGIVEEETYRLLFNGPEDPDGPDPDVFEATGGTNYRVAEKVLMTEKLEPKLALVADEYFARTGDALFITSGYRPPPRQAVAIYDNILKKGEQKVRNTYINKGAIDQVLAAYRSHKGDKDRAIAAMTETIARQVERGVFISSHLRSNALDIRVTANFVVLGSVAARFGGRLITEGDHFHMELP